MTGIKKSCSWAIQPDIEYRLGFEPPELGRSPTCTNCCAAKTAVTLDVVSAKPVKMEAKGAIMRPYPTGCRRWKMSR
jgi:hypothetical protein